VEVKPRTVSSYQHGESNPFDEWLDHLKDGRGKAQIETRINKLRRGLLGDYGDVGDGVLELKLDNVGPGYRIYIVDDGTESLILCAGSKSTQRADIARAKAYWKDAKKKDDQQIKTLHGWTPCAA
jgi:putative addiction module killer protein